MISYNTLSEAVEALKNEGYSKNLNLRPDCVYWEAKEIQIPPSDFIVEKMYRFEGATNPSDASVVYAISSSKHQIKGLLVEAFGAYADPLIAEMLEKLRYTPQP